MHNRHLVSPRPRALVVVVAALLVWASIAAVTSAAPDKSFGASFPNPELVAGASYGTVRGPIVLEIENTSNTAQLGSANVTTPAGIGPSGATVSPAGSASVVGQLIELRNLNLAAGDTATVSISAEVECDNSHPGYTWTIQAKQANDFNGQPGNDIPGNSPTTSIPGNCGLIFAEQPAHAEKLTVITDKIYDPRPAFSNPVTVAVRTADGTDTVSWWNGDVTLSKGNDPTGGLSVLTGTEHSAEGAGFFEFEPTLSISASGYTLVATATPADQASQGTQATVTSDAFNIVDDATICTSTAATCGATAGTGQKTEATVVASAGGAVDDLVILAINPANDPMYQALSGDACAGYAESSDVVVLNVTDKLGTGTSARSKIATLTLQAAEVNKSASKYQVCYENGDGPTLLSNCAARHPVLPCVVSKTLDKAKNLVIVVSFPGGEGDPGLKF
jgi:hypothetical protein